MTIIRNKPIIIPAPPIIPREISAIFDLDDTLWPQIERTFRGTPYHVSAMDTYSVTEKQIFSDEDAQYILQRFQDPALFTDIEFHPAVSRIKLLHDLGIHISIDSNSLNSAIAEVKRPQLKAAFPYLSDDRIRLSVKGHDLIASGKEIDNQVTFFIDDSPLNIVKSNAYVNLVPSMPWNCSPKEIQRMSTKNFYIIDDLNNIINTIYLSVKAWQHKS